MTLNEITPNLSDTYRLAYPNVLDAILGLSHLSDSSSYLPDTLEVGFSSPFVGLQTALETVL